MSAHYSFKFSLHNIVLCRLAKRLLEGEQRPGYKYIWETFWSILKVSNLPLMIFVHCKSCVNIGFFSTRLGITPSFRCM